MNILGRVLGGILIFVSLAWFASIAGLLPFGRNTAQQVGGTQSTNQSTTGVSTFQAPSKTATGKTATTAQGTAQGNAQTAQTTPAKPETNPRDAGDSNLTTPASPKPVAPAQPKPAAVPAGW
jgi:hypothetical protein